MKTSNIVLLFPCREETNRRGKDEDLFVSKKRTLSNDQSNVAALLRWIADPRVTPAPTEDKKDGTGG